MNKLIYTLGALALCTAVQAQTITFDTDDYKAVTGYDAWEKSPLRTGKLAPIAAVIDNHLTQENEILGYAPNATAKIAALQRSRYAGNLYGLRVDLKEPFRLTKTERYVHVMINRPVSDSRVMLITLGKRSERADQSSEVEQSWSLSSTSVGQDGWYDAVFAIKGFSYEDQTQNGIDIYSLVICPDVADRSAAQDFVCYIDQIEVNDQPTARFSIDNYAISFDKATAVSRTDRYLSGIGLSGSADGTQSITGLQTTIYNDRTREPNVFSAAPGETLQPTFSYTGTWMDGYVYVDWGNDGKFGSELNANGTPATGSDVVSYNAYKPEETWYKSDGTTVANGNQITNGVPTFTIPAATAPGLYRMRYKVDWNSIDPAGNSNSSNLLTSNGGGITDILLNIHGTQCSVTSAQLNGDIYTAQGDILQDYKTPYGEPLRIKVEPAPGFTFSGIRVRYGYNLDGDSLVHDNPQYFDVYYPAVAFTNNELTLPAEIFQYGQVEIEGYMASEKFLTLTDNPTTEAPGQITVTGTRTRTYTLTDNTHTLQDLTALQSAPVQLGNSFATDPEGDIYVDINNDGQFSMVTELMGYQAPTDIAEGVYRAVLVSGEMQYLFLINLHPEKINLTVNSLNGRIIGRQTYPTAAAYSSSTGIPEKVVPYKFLGVLAQPLVEGYQCATATIRHGYNLSGDPVVNGIRQWSEYTINVPETQRINVPIDSVCGDIIITADFTATDAATMEQAFGDEFNGTEIDSEKWVSSGRANATWRRFVSDDPRVAYLSEGSLVLRTIANDNKTTDTADMLSGARETRYRYGLNEGYVEVRAKTTPHTGNFPAIWMMPDDQTGGWPTCGEIDIWETINDNNTAYQTVHSNWTYTLGNTGSPTSSHNASYTMDGEWHTYGLLKEADKLTWYVDGTQVFTYAKSTNQDALDNGQWPFAKSFYIILNQSVGSGSWAANPDLTFDYETRIDWCRAYEKRQETAILAPDAETAPTGDTRIYDLSGRYLGNDTHGSALHKGIYIIGKEKKVIR